MARTIDTLTSGEVAYILLVAPRTASKLIDNGLLPGFLLPGSKDRRVSLTNIIEFIKKYNFPKTPLLRFLEDHGATKKQIGFYKIEEPVGIGAIRLYPKEYHVLTTGNIGDLVHCAPRTVSKLTDRKEGLAHYRLPVGSKDRRVTADNLLRCYNLHNMPIEWELENKTTLSINYPGGWEEQHNLISKPDLGESVWYRKTGKVQEVSVRCNKDGLYLKAYDNIYELVLLGMSKREDFGKITHPNHLSEIAKYLRKGILLLSDREEAAKQVLEKAEVKFNEYQGKIK